MMSRSQTPNPNRRTTLSVRLTMYYGASIVTLLILVGGVVLTGYYRHGRTSLQQRLSNEVNQLYGEVLIGATRPGFNPALTQRTGWYLLPDTDGLYVRLLAAQGQVLDQSANFAGQPLLDTPLPTSTSGVTAVDVTWNGRPLRSLYAPVFADSITLSGWIEVSGYQWEVLRTLRALLWPLGLGLLIAGILAGVVGYGLARRALKPVAALTGAIKQIQVTDLSIRLTTDVRVHDELTELAETFNAMLARLEASFERERRFISNAAHQLLNPLANMRNVAEVTLRRVRKVSAYEHTLRKMLDNIERVTNTVERLLQLSRTEAINQIQREPVDLSTLCTTQVRRFRPLAEARTLHLIARIEPQITIAANTIHIQEVVTNVLENALKYTLPEGSITVELKKEADTVRLIVSDTGIGFDAAEKERLFERFFRSDRPDVLAHAGSGLGLAIVQTIVQHYDGTISAHSEGSGSGSRFELSFPTYTGKEDDLTGQ